MHPVLRTTATRYLHADHNKQSQSVQETGDIMPPVSSRLTGVSPEKKQNDIRSAKNTQVMYRGRRCEGGGGCQCEVGWHAAEGTGRGGRGGWGEEEGGNHQQAHHGHDSHVSVDHIHETHSRHRRQCPTPACRSTCPPCISHMRAAMYVKQVLWLEL